MTGPLVLAVVFAVAALLVAAYLVGEASLDRTLARWRADREYRASITEWERARRDAAPTSQRSVP